MFASVSELWCRSGVLLKSIGTFRRGPAAVVAAAAEEYVREEYAHIDGTLRAALTEALTKVIVKAPYASPKLSHSFHESELLQAEP